MAFSLTLPELGESVTEGTVTRWLKQEGDRVEVDEPLLEISTDKVDTEVPSPVSGTVTRIVATQDTTVEVGAELAVIDDGSGGDAAPAEQAQPQTQQQAQQPAAEQDAAQQATQQAPQQAAQQAPQQPAQQPAGPAPATSGGGGTPVTLPELGESVTEGTVTRWLKQEGDRVEVDEPLLEISTDKVDTEVPSPVAGTLLEITAQADETVEVGGRLAVIGDAPASPAAAEQPQQQPQQQAQQQAQPAPSQPAQREQAQPQQAQPQQAEEPAAAANSGRHAAPETAAPSGGPSGGPSGDGAAPADGTASTPYVTPLVRKLASEHGIDLNSLQGSGVGGRIRKQDVTAAIEAKQQAPAAEPAAPAAQGPQGGPAAGSSATAAPAEDTSGMRGTTQKANRVRLTIAKRTKESLQNSAQLTQVHEVDVTKIARLREQAKAAFLEREGVKLTFLPFFAKATVEALKQHPNVNAYLDEEAQQITYYDAEHLAVAVDTDRGLISPVLHNAGDLNLAGLATRIDDLAKRTRTNKITPEELSGGTFTVTNLGSNGALFDTPIINQPQSGILGVGAVVKRPVVISDMDGNDTIAIRSMAYLALTYDHRLVDGADAGRFLTTIKHRLEEAAFESELGL
ncbi:2-oxoglutarate dehydrogenase, E2 component, dihydrolipoamide succinyltransferase [Haloechinothrix sp. YIM 98757]|uniref:Dihydrolipoamide acetyltransferase component of pyruvate dehydrogenase complex n=1 Tax=Haloechinothrix aidingensis TaxID=2752311 RepID=A0A838A9S2_9PSEU|nr:2-oxoglutarate dehydrogenase, E2 component, dihydrolipoamide succinyltransferase [Haloechinothrix aidingensis]MBA0125581.1 2-oxoglutarate dehydrogenase, E2 component, dihydrolipoamide succinyltransferase [Haloechinothrix aidingensis]